LKSHVFLFIFNICLSVDIIYHCWAFELSRSNR
jgi:hypothetical protein